MDPNLEARQNLIRGLGLAAAISVIIANVIGTGVFVKARVMTCNVGEPTWVVIAWIAAGVLSLAGALTYAELTAFKPEAAGPYAFLRDSYGKVSSFLFGWMQMFIARTGSQAAAAVLFAGTLDVYLGGGLKQTLGTVPIIGNEFTSLQLIAVVMIAIFTTLNCLSVTMTGQIATMLTAIKIGLVVFVGFGAFLFITGGSFANFSLAETNGTCIDVNDIVNFGSVEYSFAAGFGAAMLAALWGYDGWDNLSFMAGEVKNPARNIPMAIIGSVLLVIVLYAGVHVAYYYVLDPTTIASIAKNTPVPVVNRFFAMDAATFATGIAVAIFSIGLMLSALGVLHTSLMSGSRVPYAMAKDGLMFNTFQKVSIQGVPVNGVIFMGVWASILALSGSFDTLTDYVVFGSWIFYALITSSIFIFRRKYPDAPRPYKAWGYPIVPVIFLLVAGWLLINTMYTAPQSSFIGLGLIILGLPVYYYLTNKAGDGGKTSEQTDGNNG